MVRVLPPWSENIGKRVVKTPKVYIADTGLLHALLDIPSARALEAHPKIGATFEGFALQYVVRALHARPDQCYGVAPFYGPRRVDAARRPC
jgi:predicted AAA+ superfamily ATPase